MSKASSIFNKLAQEHRSTYYTDKDIEEASKKDDWKTKRTDSATAYPSVTESIRTGLNNDMRSDTLTVNIPNTEYNLIRHLKPDGEINWEHYAHDKGGNTVYAPNVKQYLPLDEGIKKTMPSTEEIDKAHEANKKNKALKKEGEYNMSKADNVMEKVGQLKALKAGLKWIDKGIQTIGRKVLGKVKSTKSGKKVLKNKKWADARKKKTKRIVGGTVAAGGAYAGKKIVD